MENTVTKTVRQLNTGDYLVGSESTIIYAGHIAGGKRRVDVRYKNGKELTRYWGVSTTMTVVPVK